MTTIESNPNKKTRKKIKKILIKVMKPHDLLAKKKIQINLRK